MSDEITGVKDGLFFGLLIGVFIDTSLTFIVNNYKHISINNMFKVSQICHRASSTMEKIYFDGDAECRNGLFIDKKLIDNEQLKGNGNE